jgi:hypothetical protein
MSFWQINTTKIQSLLFILNAVLFAGLIVTLFLSETVFH